MKIKVTTEHGCGRVYLGVELGEDEHQPIKEIILKAVKGELSYLSFISNFGGRVYIPSEVLKTSVIELTEE